MFMPTSGFDFTVLFSMKDLCHIQWFLSKMVEVMQIAGLRATF